MATLRPELTELPPRMRRLPLDHRGYPVPWFVPWIDGVAEFRATDAGKFLAAVRGQRCWICGEPLGRYLTFALGPMCTITRTTSEPPCHHECATFAARNCPFLVRPHMVRREDDFTRSLDTVGIMLARNPGVVALWTAHGYEMWRDPLGKPLLTVGEPVRTVEWYCEGRAATRAEVEAAIASGFPALDAMCDQEREAERETARRALQAAKARALSWLPAEA
jgi:hypothetical protein